MTQALLDFETPRRPHTAFQSQTAYKLGQSFHHAPLLVAPIRDVILDHTPFLQRVIGKQSGKIVSQLAEVDEAEAKFLMALGR